MNVCFSGLGGQGIVLLGVALGEAAARSGLNALQTQSYGAEARGGASYSAVIISRERILDIAPEDWDALVALSQPAYDRFSGALKLGGTLIYDSDLVRPAEGAGIPPPANAGGVSRSSPLPYSPKAEALSVPANFVKGIPSTALAKKHLGKELYANMVMFGYFVKVSNVVDKEKARQAIAASVPQRTVDDNLKAFEIGFKYPQ
jgi:2-oxoglutarate ferredoxin oxidoreductase subunit gamma